MISALLACLQAGLSIWDSKEKTKYIDKIIKLKEQYREEMSKPADSRSDSVLDDIEFELRLTSTAFVAAVGVKNA